MVGILAGREMKRLGLEIIVKTKFSVDAVFFWQRKHQLDIDGAFKPLLDSMIGIAYSNDRYALPRGLSYEYSEDNPRIEFCVSAPPTNLVELLC